MPLPVRASRPAITYTKLTMFPGGQLRSNTKDNKVKYGDWDPNAVRCHTTPFIRIPD